MVSDWTTTRSVCRYTKGLRSLILRLRVSWYSCSDRTDTITGIRNRIFARTPLQYWKELERIGVRAGFGNEFLRLGSLKAFIDGALGSNTAYLFEPYLDEPQNYGLLNSIMIPETKIRKLVRDADKSGLNLS